MKATVRLLVASALLLHMVVTRAFAIDLVSAAVAKIALDVVKDPKIIGRKLNDVPFEMPSVITKTMGGHTFWKDEDKQGGWRFQCNKIARNCRILDPDDYRFAWGGKDAVRKTFKALKANGMVFYRSTGLPDLQATLGGKVFWEDLASEGGWRVQQNKLSGHCRIIDPQDQRLAWGRCDDLAQASKADERHE